MGHFGTILAASQALYAARMSEKEEWSSEGAGTPKINLRLPEPLRSEIIAASAACERSINGEIVHRLKKTVQDERDTHDGIVRTQLGLIRFLSSCIGDLAAMLTEEQLTDTKVQLILALTKSLSDQPDLKKQ